MAVQPRASSICWVPSGRLDPGIYGDVYMRSVANARAGLTGLLHGCHESTQIATRGAHARIALEGVFAICQSEHRRMAEPGRRVRQLWIAVKVITYTLWARGIRRA